jgi:hypothetical protein
MSLALQFILVFLLGLYIGKNIKKSITIWLMSHIMKDNKYRDQILSEATKKAVEESKFQRKINEMMD